jgi:hypothetical protein
MVATRGHSHRHFPSIHVSKDGLGVFELSIRSKASEGPIVFEGISWRDLGTCYGFVSSIFS